MDGIHFKTKSYISTLVIATALCSLTLGACSAQTEKEQPSGFSNSTSTQPLSDHNKALAGEDFDKSKYCGGAITLRMTYPDSTDMTEWRNEALSFSQALDRFSQNEGVPEIERSQYAQLSEDMKTASDDPRFLTDAWKEDVNEMFAYVNGKIEERCMSPIDASGQITFPV